MERTGQNLMALSNGPIGFVLWSGACVPSKFMCRNLILNVMVLEVETLE